MLNGLSLTTTSIAGNLHLLENSWCKHVLLDLYSMSTTYVAGIDLAICTSGAFALVADLLSFELEFRGVAVVEVSKRDAYSYFHVWSTSLSLLVSEMSAASEESGEQIEWIMVSSSPASLLPLLEPLMSVLVVYFPRFRI